MVTMPLWRWMSGRGCLGLLDWMRRNGQARLFYKSKTLYVEINRPLNPESD